MKLKNMKKFHMPNNDSKFAAECINTGLIKHYELYKIINKELKYFFKEKK